MNTPETTGAAGLSFPRRVIGIFFSPAVVFDELRERPSWVAPLLTVIAVSFLLSLTIPESLIRDVIEAQMSARGEVTQEQLDAAMKFASISRYAGGLVGPLLGVLVTSGVLFLAFTLLAGGEARFGHYFSGTAHAFLIQVLGAVVTTPIVLTQEDLEARLSFALLVPGLESGFLYSLLNGITIFGLWTSVVLGIGGSRLSRSVRTGSAVAVVVGLYVLLAIGSAVIASLTGRA